MPQRRLPAFPVPNGVIWHHLHTDMPADKPLAEWAYTTPLHPEGLLTSDLPHSTEGEQDATATHWFLVNFRPLGGGWAAYDTPEAGGYDVGPSGYAPQSWPANHLLHEEFDSLLSAALIDEIAARFAPQSNLWRVIPNLIVTPSVDLNRAELAETVEEVKARLDRAERLLAEYELARRQSGGNELDPFVTHQIKSQVATAIADGRVALTTPQPQQANAVEQARAAFWTVLTEVGKGAAQQAGRLGMDWVANHGLLLWQEMALIVPALQHLWNLIR